MFKRAMKKHSINVKLVNDQDAGTTTDETVSGDPWENVEIAAAYAEIAKDLITHASLVIGGTFAACKIIGRICR